MKAGTLLAGTVIVSAPGVSAPAADYFEIKVQGKGCHGSMPNAGVDPLNAAAHILIALQEIHARELAMGDQAVLTIGTMHAGKAANAIPDTATMGGSIRTFDEETRAFIKERMVTLLRENQYKENESIMYIKKYQEKIKNQRNLNHYLHYSYFHHLMKQHLLYYQI